MNISGKKRDELYNSFADNIMDLRVELTKNPRLADNETLDNRLFRLEREIWTDIKKVLNI